MVLHLKVAFDRHAVGGCALELGQIAAQAHDPVGVVDLAVFGTTSAVA
jgi:hypothetical protein